MSIHRPSLRAALPPAAAILAALALGGCVTLFPKSAPDQLYRFEGSVAGATPAAGVRTDVQLAALDFDTAASGDKILTTRGDSVAYISGARWAEPASDLFRQSLQQAFSAGGRIRMVSAGQIKASYRLRLTVTRFEAEYSGGGKDAAPTVVVTVHAALERQSDFSLVGADDFEGTAPAGENRVGAIVTAYDTAVSKALGDLSAWVATQTSGG